MKAFPFISQAHALLLLRVVTALLFMAHAVMRIVNGTIPNFAKYMESVGLPQPTAVVWAITLCELIAGTLIIAGYYVRWASTSLFIIAATGIVLIHRHFGWFVGEHGTGGSEYSIALMIMLIVVAATDREKMPAASASSAI